MENNGGIEQFNGREAKTATFYNGSSEPAACVLPVFAHVISIVSRFVVKFRPVKIKLTIFAFLVCFLATSNSVFGQAVADDETYVIPSNESGELHSAMTDALAVEIQQSNERLFVIVHPGSSDTNSRVSLARLVGVRTYLSRKKYGSLKPVFSLGERVEGEGRIEYYVGSKLRLIMFAPKNKIPNYTCCDDYIPPKKKPKRKKRKR